MPTPLTTFSLDEQPLQQVQIWYENPLELSEGAWVAVPRLRCESLVMTAQPVGGISNARLTYDYGYIDANDPNNPGFVQYAPLGTAGSVLADLDPFASQRPGGIPHFQVQHRLVRIVLLDPETGLPDTRWVGCLVAAEDAEFKQPRPPATDVDTVLSWGTQLFQARGPEWLLDRRQVNSSFVRNGELENSYSVSRGLPFNSDRDRFSSRLFPNAAFVDYASDKDERTLWTGWSIIRNRFYIVAVGVADTTIFFLVPEAAAATAEGLTSWFTPQFDPHLMTYYQLLNEVVNPRRGLAYTVNYVPVAGEEDVKLGDFHIKVHSFSSAAINLPGGATIPANTDTITLAASGTVDARISLTTDYQGTYDAVVVEGARIGHVLTRQVYESDLFSEGWSEEDEAGYKTLPDAMPEGIDDTDEEVIRSYREQLYPDVYTRFVCDPDFDFDADGITRYDVHRPAARWARLLPLKEGWDYTVDPPEKKAGARDEPEFIPMFSVYRITTIDGSDRFAFGDRMGQSTKRIDSLISEDSARNVTIRPLDDAFGISLTPQGTQPHWQAKGQTGFEESDVVPLVDYQTDIWVTGYFQEDTYASGQWPDDVVDTYGNVLYIGLGDIAFFDTLHAGTIVGLTDVLEKEVSPDKDVVLRDDRSYLQDIARMAYEWYAKPRLAYAVSYSQLVRDVYPGQVVINVDGAPTDTLVTEIAWDFNNRQTNIATAFAEPDIRLIALELPR